MGLIIALTDGSSRRDRRMARRVKGPTYLQDRALTLLAGERHNPKERRNAVCPVWTKSVQAQRSSTQHLFSCS